jgi:hypothetical protein
MALASMNLEKFSESLDGMENEIHTQFKNDLDNQYSMSRKSSMNISRKNSFNFEAEKLRKNSNFEWENSTDINKIGINVRKNSMRKNSFLNVKKNSFINFNVKNENHEKNDENGNYDDYVGFNDSLIIGNKFSYMYSICIRIYVYFILKYL